MCCTGESSDSRTALLALRGFHLLAMLQTRIRKKSLRISSMLWRKAVFYSINLLIYDMNTSSINSVRLKGQGKYRSFRGVRLLNRLNDVAQ